jgi:hypothetical protein
VPAGELHGDWANLAIEADGVLMGRARLQLFRPISVRCSDAVRLRVGPSAELPVEPPVVPADARSGRNLEIVLHNNSTRIETIERGFHEGLSFARKRKSRSANDERQNLRCSREVRGRAADVKVRSAAAELTSQRLLLIPARADGGVVGRSDGDGSADGFSRATGRAQARAAEEGGWSSPGGHWVNAAGERFGSGPKRWT